MALNTQIIEQNKKKPDVAKITDAKVQDELAKLTLEFEAEREALKELIKEDE